MEYKRKALLAVATVVQLVSTKEFFTAMRPTLESLLGTDGQSGESKTQVEAAVLAATFQCLGSLWFNFSAIHATLYSTEHNVVWMFSVMCTGMLSTEWIVRMAVVDCIKRFWQTIWPGQEKISSGVAIEGGMEAEGAVEARAATASMINQTVSMMLTSLSDAKYSSIRVRCLETLNVMAKRGLLTERLIEQIDSRLKEEDFQRDPACFTAAQNLIFQLRTILSD